MISRWLLLPLRMAAAMVYSIVPGTLFYLMGMNDFRRVWYWAWTGKIDNSKTSWG